MTQVGLIPTTSTQSSQPASTTSVHTPGKEDFLKLLVAELQHQNPMQPMDDMTSITQLAQFNTLEQMKEMNASIESFTATQSIMEAASLLGRTVGYRDGSTASLTGSLLSGLVSRVSWETGTPKLSVNNKEVDLTQIVSVE